MKVSEWVAQRTIETQISGAIGGRGRGKLVGEDHEPGIQDDLQSCALDLAIGGLVHRKLTGKRM